MSFGIAGRTALVLAAGLALAACQSSSDGGGGSSSTVRATVTTAPADLQLICASEASTRFSAASNTVLPVSSQQVDGGQYRVNLTVDGNNAACVIDDNANIISLELV